MACFVLATIFFSASVQAREVIVTESNGTQMYLSLSGSGLETHYVSYGERLKVIGEAFPLIKVQATTKVGMVTGYIDLQVLGNCGPDRKGSVKRLQICLSKTGHPSGIADGVMGAKTRSAMARFMKTIGLEERRMELSCVEALACAKTERSRISRTRLEFIKEAAIKALSSPALATQIASAKEAYEALRCEDFATIPIDAQMFHSEADCQKRKERSAARAMMSEALAKLNCDEAEQLRVKASGTLASIRKCQKDLKRRDQEDALAHAIESFDCVKVAELQKFLQKTGQVKRCQMQKLEATGDETAFRVEIAQAIEREEFDVARRFLATLEKKFPLSLGPKEIVNVTAQIERAEDVLIRLDASRTLYSRLATLQNRTSRYSLVRGSSSVKRLQSGLDALGFAPGAADGKMGKATKEALRDFQNAYGLKRTKRPTNAQTRLIETLAEKVDLRHSLQDLNTEPYAGQYGKEDQDLFPSCRLSRRSSFGVSKKSARECGYVNAAGSWVVPPVFTTTSEFKGGFGHASYNGKAETKHWFIDRKGLIADTKTYYSIFWTLDRSAWRVCTDSKRCGIKSLDLKTWLVKPNYIQVDSLGAGFYFRRNDRSSDVVNINTGSKITGSHIGKHVVRRGAQFISSKDDNVTVFGKDSEPFKLKYKGYLTQDCTGRLMVNDPDGKKSVIYLPKEKLFLSVPGSFVSYETPGKRCRDRVIYSNNKGYHILDLKTRKTIASFDRFSARDGNAELLSFGKDINSRESRYGVYDWDGRQVVAPNFRKVAISTDNSVAAVRDFEVEIFQLEKDSQGAWQDGNRQTYSGDWATTIYGKPGYFRIVYGSGYHYAGGSYLARLGGEVIPKTAKVELEMFMAACEQGIRNLDKSGNALRRACERYLKMRGKSTPANPKPNPDALMAVAYVEASKGNKEKILPLLRQAARAGSMRAQADLGLMYFEGDGFLNVRRNHAEAAKWFMRAASNGDDDAQFNLSLMYLNGYHLPKDYKRSYFWASASARQGNPDGLHNKGVLEDYFASVAASERRKAQSLTLGDVFRGLGRYMPSDSEVRSQRAASSQRKQCRAQQTQCYASCQGVSDKGISLLGDLGSPRRACKSKCSKLRC